jgi:hypothetical protein
MPCQFSEHQAHQLRNGAMALSYALSRLYRSPLFSNHATKTELGFLKDAQSACERIRLALDSCEKRPECEIRSENAVSESGFWP